ncbi:hypothetical protein FWP53_24455 [Vibrio parahaemolyticus]|nr:hypothetical protein [Vibrio parahaemolyticus]
MRCSPLNRALVANEENVAKAECLGLMFVCFWACFRILIFSFWVCENRLGFLCGLDLLFQKPIYLLKVSSVKLSI